MIQKTRPAKSQTLTHVAVGYTADTVAIKVTAKDDDVVAGAAIRVDQRTVSLTEVTTRMTPAVRRVRRSWLDSPSCLRAMWW